MYYVYYYQNKSNNKIYVGQTNNIKRRHKEHSKTRQNRQIIDRAIRKYGIQNFVFHILENFDTIEESNEAEEFWIQYLECLVPNGYNLSTGGGNFKFSNETRIKMSKSHTGIKRIPFTQEHKFNISKGKIGKSCSPQTQFKRKVTIEMAKNIKSEITNGVTQQEIALKYNISTRSVRRAIYSI